PSRFSRSKTYEVDRIGGSAGLRRPSGPGPPARRASAEPGARPRGRPPPPRRGGAAPAGGPRGGGGGAPPPGPPAGARPGATRGSTGGLRRARLGSADPTKPTKPPSGRSAWGRRPSAGWDAPGPAPAAPRVAAHDPRARPS